MQTKHHSNLSQPTLRSLLRPARLFVLAAGIATLSAPVQAERPYLSWAQQHDLAVNASQNGVAVAMDRRGNVAATGFVIVNGREVYYTVKYDASSGARMWQVNLDRGFGNNRPASVVCDSQGDVIVTGRSVGNGTSMDYLTVKYNGATGQEMWRAVYNNTDNDTDGLDEAIKVVVDFNDDVIVTGKSVNSGSSDDYYTIKYNKANGSKLWATRYDSVGKFSDKPADMAVDSFGNVVVTGVSRVGSNECFYSAKYASASGAKLWDKVHDGAANKDDAGTAVAIDSTNAVAITGIERNADGTGSIRTFRYLDDGTFDWSRKYDHPDATYVEPKGVAVDGEGNVFVCSTSRLNNFKVTYLTVKYKFDTGATVWTKDARTEAPGGTDEVTDFGIDGNGNPVVTGSSKNTEPDIDFYTVKFDGGTGDLLWEQRVAGPTDSGTDIAYGLAVDAVGNVAVTGTAKKAAPSAFNEMLTLKINRFLLASGDPIQGPGLTSAAVVTAFNVPAISNNSIVASKVTVKDGKKVLAAVLKQGGGQGNRAFALQTGAAPDVGGTAAFKSFSDPVISPGGRIAFSAKLSGVPGTEAAGVWTNVFNNTLQRALQYGKQAPGLDMGILVKGVTSISLRDSQLVSLVTLKGSGVNGTNSTALIYQTAPTVGVKLLRTGDDLMADGSTSKIKKITVYTPPKTSPGHGRYHGNGRVVALVTLADKRTVFVAVNAGGSVVNLGATNGDATNVASGAKWKAFGLPAVAGNGFSFASLATLQPKLGGVISASDTAIVYSTAGAALTDLAREGTAATGTGGGTYTSFADPLSNDQGAYAFLGSFKGGSFGNANRAALWFGKPNALDLVAYVGMEAPISFGGWSSSTFSALTNIALPSGADAGPLFLATIKGGGVSGKNNFGLWGVDTEGYLRLLFRNGDSLGDQVVKKFTLLNSLPGSFSATRSFNNSGGLAALVNFTDKSSAIVYIPVP